MKKTITICLILLATFSVNAQQKPTKEETVKFINRTLQTMIYRGVKNKQYKTVSFNDIKFNAVYEDGNRLKETETWSDFVWESLNSISVQIENDVATLFLSFDKMPNCKRIIEESGDIKVTEKPKLTLVLYIADSQKGESLKKAFERLSEIYKEENNDPFKN